MLFRSVAGLIAVAGGGRKATAWPLFVYLIFAAIYVIPAIYLHRYASRLKRLMLVRTPEMLEQAIEAQKSFWKFVGLTFLIIAGFYLVIIFIAIISFAILRRW